MRTLGERHVDVELLAGSQHVEERGLACVPREKLQGQHGQSVDRGPVDRQDDVLHTVAAASAALPGVTSETMAPQSCDSFSPSAKVGVTV